MNMPNTNSNRIDEIRERIAGRYPTSQGYIWLGVDEIEYLLGELERLQELCNNHEDWNHAEKCVSKALERERDQAREENERLRAALNAAPHQYGFNQCSETWGDECDCWKRDALKGVKE